MLWLYVVLKIKELILNLSKIRLQTNLINLQYVVMSMAFINDIGKLIVLVQNPPIY